MITDAQRAGTGSLIVTSEERRALALLANNPNGVTEAMLMAHGFAVSMLTLTVSMSMLPDGWKPKKFALPSP